jgi:hypothetical protein
MESSVLVRGVGMKTRVSLHQVIKIRTSLRSLTDALPAPFVWLLPICIFASTPAYAAELTPSITVYVIWIIASLFMLGATIVVLWGVSRRFAATVVLVQDKYESVIANIEKDVRLYIEPSIAFKKTRHEMRELLLPELEEFFFKSGEKNVVILGADQLRPSFARYTILQEKSVHKQLSGPEEDVEYRYGLVFNKILARSSDKLLRRFIYLFRPQDLQGRTRNFREDYLNWLTDQVRFFEINENYTIINTPRATVWGAPKSIIFFQNNMVEVFFRGGGVVVTSQSRRGTESVVSATRTLLIDQYVDNKIDGPTRVEYSKINLPAFEEYISSIRAEVQQGQSP